MTFALILVFFEGRVVTVSHDPPEVETYMREYKSKGPASICWVYSPVS